MHRRQLQPCMTSVLNTTQCLLQEPTALLGTNDQSDNAVAGKEPAEWLPS
jgi:hypothetical protein